MNISKIAAQAYRRLPEAGFTWHKAEEGRAALEEIFVKAQESGDQKAMLLAQAALKSPVARNAERGYAEPDSKLDAPRLNAYAATLATLSSSMSAPISVLLARTGLEALDRSKGKDESIRTESARGFVEQLQELGDLKAESVAASAAGYTSGLQALAGPLGTTGQALGFMRDVMAGHKSLGGQRLV